MSFRIMHITVDGTLANPFVAVAMAMLCVLSFFVAYRVACGPYVPRVLLPWGLCLLLLIVFPEGWIHFLTNWIYVVYYLDGTLQVGFIGGHTEWLAQYAAVLGGIAGVARLRRRLRQAT
jgi:hypothetical protein